MAATEDVLIALAGSEVVAVTSDLLEWRWADFGPEELGDWWVSVTAISAWSGGLVAVGLDHHGHQPVTWHYRGDHFQKTEMGPAEGPGGTVMDVTPFGEGLVVAGSSDQLPRGDDRSAFPVVWVSPDGLSWSRIEIPTEEWSVQFTHVTASEQGLVALGRPGNRIGSS